MNYAMATLGLKEMGKFLWEGRESWLSQFSFAMQKKVWYYYEKLGWVGRHASFPQKPVVNTIKN